MTNVVLLLISIAFAAIRFALPPRLEIPTAVGSYEAFVHLFTGGLIGAWMVKRSEWSWLAMAVAISLLEVVVFLVQKYAQ